MGGSMENDNFIKEFFLVKYIKNLFKHQNKILKNSSCIWFQVDICDKFWNIEQNVLLKYNFGKNSWNRAYADKIFI